MRALAVHSCLAILFAVGCKTSAPRVVVPPAAPLDVPLDARLEAASDYDAHRDAAMSCMRWLIQTHPSAQPETWTRARDFALDWIEGAPQTDDAPRTDILDEVVEDRRFIYGMYMPAAYASGRTLRRLEHPNSDAVELEIAAIRGMQRLYEVFRGSDDEARSRPLDKLRKLEAKGELEAWVRARVRARLRTRTAGPED